ncbi:MAG TPA: hypothetical protein VD996_01630 [Chitinophagaceae bacterium]|nr:hypothetical protein [Chitinophagaceae bacterium]
MKKVLLGLLSLTLIATTACKKGKDAPAFTKENVIGSYKIERVTFKADAGGGEQDVTSEQFEDCELDDILTLKNDFTYDKDDAGEPCNGDESGTWGIPAANKFQMDTEVFDVTTWDGTTVGVSSAVELMPGISGVVTMYMKKQ